MNEPPFFTFAFMGSIDSVCAGCHLRDLYIIREPELTPQVVMEVIIRKAIFDIANVWRTHTVSLSIVRSIGYANEGESEPA